MGVTTNHNRLGPARHKPGNIGDDDGLAEDHAAENVSNGAVWAAPHLLESKFFDSCLIGGDSRTLHTDPVGLNGVRGINGDLVICLITVLNREIVVLEIDVQEGQD